MNKTYTGIQLMVGAREQLQNLSNKLKELEEWSYDKKNHDISYHLSKYNDELSLRGTIYGYKVNAPYIVRSISNFKGFFNSTANMTPFKMIRDNNGIYSFDKKVVDRMEFTNSNKFKEVADSLLHDDFAQEINLHKFIKQEPNYAAVVFDYDSIAIRNNNIKCEYKLNTECIEVSSFEPFNSDMVKDCLNTSAMHINNIKDVSNKEVIHDYSFNETDNVDLGVLEEKNKIIVYKI